MSRSIHSTIATAERDTVQDWSHELISRREFWSMTPWASSSSANLVTDVPPSWVMRSGSDQAYVITRHTDGSSRVRVVDTSNVSDVINFSLTHSQISCTTIRPGLVRLSNGECWLYAADHGAGGVQLRRAQLTGTSNNLSFTLANHGPAFGPAYESSSTRVRRVEACAPTENGCIVAVGTHDFALKLSTIQFWHVDTAGVPYQLDALLQMPLTTVYTDWGSVWHGGARYACNVTAFWHAGNKRLHVIANDQTRGRAVMFSIQNGVESAIRPVIEIDPEATLISLMPYSVTEINGIFYLTARWTRKVRVGQTEQEAVAWDMALTSIDGLNWSFGDLSNFLSDTPYAGAVLMKTTSPAYLVYAGLGPGGVTGAARAEVTELQAPSANKRVDLLPWLEGFDVQRVSSAADEAGFTLTDEMLAGGVSVHAVNLDGHMSENGTLMLKSGQGGQLTPVGWYLISKSRATVDMQAWGPRDISGSDVGSARCIGTRALVDVDIRGRQIFSSSLTDLDDLSIQTPVYGDDDDKDVITGKDGMIYRGLNSPMLALFGEGDDNGDCFVEMTVTFPGTDVRCLASIGFVFGANEKGEGNVFLVPKAGSWTFTGQPTAVTSPAMRTLALRAVDENDPNKADTGWNFDEGINALWRALVTDAVRTTTTPGFYGANPGFTFTAGVTYDVVFRLSGRRAQLCAKVRDYDPADAANNAGYTLISEFLFDYQAKRAQAGRDMLGIAASIDVAGSAAWFAQGAVSDMSVQLTDAANTLAFTRLYTTGIRQHDNGYQISGVSTAALRVGMKIGLSSGTTDPVTIVSISGGNVVTDYYLNPSDPGGGAPLIYNYPVSIYLQAVGEDWGYADSGAVKETQAGGTVETYLNPNARLVSVKAGGRAGFFSRDATAYSPRFVVTSGKRHKLKSGSDFTGGTYIGWDLTNPLQSNQSENSGSKPGDWRMILAGGIVFEDDPVIYGLPTGISAAAYMRKGKGGSRERIRVVALTVTNRGVYPGDTPVIKTRYCVPAYYTSVADAAENATQLRNWRKGAFQPGDDLGDVPLAPGLQVKVISAANGIDKPEDQLYAIETLKASSPTDNNTSIVYLDKPFPGPVTGPRYDPNDANKVIGDGDLLILDGRGQFGDKQVTHPKDAPCVYWPGNITTGEQDHIKLHHIRAYTGLVVTAEDAIRRLCAMGGMHYPQFRNYHTAPASDAAITLSTSFQDLPLKAAVANFALSTRVHIGGNNTGSGGVTTMRRLYVRFRGYYQFAVWQQVTAAEYASGSAGRVVVGLATTSTDISAPSSGDLRWLALSPALMVANGYNISGTVSGSNPTYTLTEDVTRLVDLRLIVNNNLVTVEINGKHLWTFDLDRFTNGTNTYRSDAAGPISVAYSSSVPGYTSTWRVLELGEEVTPRYTVREGQTAAQGVAGICNNRHIRWIATVEPAAYGGAGTGGVRFSRFWTRDDVGTMTENISGQTPERDALNRAGLQGVQGQTYGAYLDLAHIRARGFSAALSRTDFATTPELADQEAYLLAREAAEYADPRQIQAGAYLELDPEDKANLVYSNAGDRPAQAATDIVVTRFRIATGRSLKQLNGTYNVRRFIA